MREIPNKKIRTTIPSCQLEELTVDLWLHSNELRSDKHGIDEKTPLKEYFYSALIRNVIYLYLKILFLHF